MHKIVIWLFVGMLLCCLTIQAGESRLGIGAFGGLNMPIAQDDQSSGMTYGIAGRFRVLPFLTAEPNLTFTKWGRPDPISGVEMPDGSDFNSIGLDVLLGGAPGIASIQPYFVVGVASYKVENEETLYDESGLGYSGGLGVGVGLMRSLELDVRGKLHVAPQEEGSKKALTLTAGLLYKLAAF